MNNTNACHHGLRLRRRWDKGSHHTHTNTHFCMLWLLAHGSLIHGSGRRRAAEQHGSRTPTNNTNAPHHGLRLRRRCDKGLHNTHTNTNKHTLLHVMVACSRKSDPQVCKVEGSRATWKQVTNEQYQRTSPWPKAEEKMRQRLAPHTHTNTLCCTLGLLAH